MSGRQAGSHFAWPGSLRVAWRLPLLLAVLSVGLVLTLLLRPAERLVAGAARPLTPHVTRAVCRAALAIMGVALHRVGAPAAGPGAYVANHGSWFDIFVLNACAPMYFVAKSEVAAWPGIGWLARATGTLFITRRSAEAAAQAAVMRSRLAAGQRLMFFPEGTSTDGLSVLPFKTTLFAPLVDAGLRDRIDVQPVSVGYRPPAGAEPRHFGWWGDMEFAPHLLKLLAAPAGGAARVIFHRVLRPADLPDRKALAAAAEQAVREGHARPMP